MTVRSFLPALSSFIGWYSLVFPRFAASPWRILFRIQYPSFSPMITASMSIDFSFFMYTTSVLQMRSGDEQS